jgi:hypothetical protein
MAMRSNYLQRLSQLFTVPSLINRGPGSSVGIANAYGLGGPGIESRCGRDFPPVQTVPRAHPASCTMGTGSFSGVKCSRGLLLTTHPLLVPRSWKSTAIPLPPSGPRPGLRWAYFTTLPFSATKILNSPKSMVLHC